jgi:hypothetical protein
VSEGKFATLRQDDFFNRIGNNLVVQSVDTPSFCLPTVHAPSWQRHFLSFTRAGAKISAVTSKPNIAFA